MPSERAKQRAKRGIAAMLPLWTDSAGGRNAWKKWLDTKVNACVRRAAAWAAKRQKPIKQLPRRSEWREAILDALRLSGGRAYYSKFPLSLAPPRKNTDWNWPSVDHISGPEVAKVVIETRLVNDMKTITCEEEFRAIIGHLATVLGVEVKEVGDDWHCQRAFAIDERPDVEPPLPA
jgi:hypothetical protein